MDASTVAVFGTYRRPDEAEEAVGALIIKGFPSEAISALIPEDLARQKPEPVPLDDETARHLIEKEISRGTVGLLDHVGAISIPRLGLFIGAGPLMNALAAKQSSSLATALQQVGAPPAEAKHYQRLLKHRAIVSVRCADPESAVRARQVLTRSGAETLSSSAEIPEPPKARHGGISPL